MRDSLLQTVSPESVGISSGAISDYIDGVIGRGVNLHSFIMMRHGKICAEGYCPPYTEDRLQRMYSMSKSFTAIAVGLMIDEGKISLNDKVADYFPEYMPENPHPYVLSMTIEDLLKMATPFTLTNHHDKGGPWVKTFFNSVVTHAPGSTFLYATAAPHTLCALVEKISGMSMLDFMRTRLLDEIGFSKESYCIKGTDGYSWGGSGIMATLRDLAKVASVLLNGGSFRGRQLISEEYVKRATSCRIYTPPRNAYLGGGYGYQIWMMKDGGFAFHGQGSQYAVCFPEKDFLFCCTAGEQGSEINDYLIVEQLYETVLPVIGESLDENPDALIALRNKCAQMQLKTQCGAGSSPMVESINGRSFILDENPMDISELTFSFFDKRGVLSYRRAGEDKKIEFGFGQNVEFLFPEKHYYGEQIGVPSGKEYRAYASAGWVNPETLIIRIMTLDEYLGTLTMRFSFKDDDITVLMGKNAEWFFDEYQGIAGGKMVH